MKLISLHIPQSYLEDLEMVVQKGRFPNRAEAIRTAIRDFIQVELILLSAKEKGDISDH